MSEFQAVEAVVLPLWHLMVSGFGTVLFLRACWAPDWRMAFAGLTLMLMVDMAPK